MKRIILIISVFILFIANGCVNNASSSDSERSNSVNGRYMYSDSNLELEITVSGETWRGKTRIISGIGSEYDNQNAQYDYGIIKGTDLFESSGIVKIGYIKGKTITTSIAGQMVTLRKK